MPRIDINDKYSCCGCGACEAICPTKAISIDIDEEGFLYPSFDDARCLNCGKCLKTCAFRADKIAPYPRRDGDGVSCYAVQHSDDTVRAASRSGGIFTALSDRVLAMGGVVYGCAMDGVLRARHVRADSVEGRDAMRGSKYIESDMRGVFPLVEADLNTGIEVLFSGTSCQVAGLLSYLGKPYENLLRVDIVCHGVPSPKVWADYVRWIERENNGRCTAVDFRDKGRFGWRAHTETLYLNDGSKVVSGETYRRIFYGHRALRRSCYECPYKSVEHPSDLTIGDYWGVEDAAPEFDDNRGVSLVLVNTARGREAFEYCKPVLRWKATEIEKSLQPPLKAPFDEPSDRGLFWKRYDSWDFSRIAKSYGTLTFRARLRKKLKRAFHLV
ncbi:Coenzyme F420 hydrogenase/dehydrogenase, beta subunit C-terminal domain [Paratractidigestivibacter sp.]|uniref:Coenzyme F420 hydrogenase/dehydrogenase, beta subunit C-terminal domain n=1 Tax=Paratractidigestivibacter sp. TaxID=2847316 RepID=UPI002ABE6047|nr:Coenzyme F420 hydrogenase/dehydrogenase, beta subunit C-terminal domain [Paratractidigestivibacter sp.]